MQNYLTKYAQLLVNFCNEVQPDERVLIRGPALAIDLIEAIYEECVKVGAHVFYEFEETENMRNIFSEYATEKQRAYLPKWLSNRLDEIDCYFGICGEENTKEASNNDLEMEKRQILAGKELDDKWDECVNSGKLRWVIFLYPTNAYAQDAEMSLSEFKRFLFRACKLHHKNPIVSWKKIRTEQQKITDYLNESKRIRIVSPGTDLRFSVKDRTWINCFGTENMPDGEIFTSPIEDSVEGYITFSYPACYCGHEVENVKLTFKNGRVSKIKAKKNEEYLKAILETDEGAKQVGEFAIGLNKDVQSFTKEILLNEKIGGTIHIALGSSYPEAGGLVKSSIHWDMVCDLRDGGKIYTDGKLFMHNGQLVIEV